MGTTIDKINKVFLTKSEIKSSIIAKGIKFNDTETFAMYPSKINSIKTITEIDDADTKPSDILYKKVAYSNYGKIVGAIETFNRETTNEIDNDSSNSVITISEQEGIKLLTKGKYCDRNIQVILANDLKTRELTQEELNVILEMIK